MNANFIKLIDYYEWMANVIPITNPIGEMIICTNFYDINNACPKDDFLLPNVDMIMDSIAGHDTLSFMDIIKY